jgi:hypothetical protein
MLGSTEFTWLLELPSLFDDSSGAANPLVQLAVQGNTVASFLYEGAGFP